MSTPEEFLQGCNALMSGQDPVSILSKAHQLLEDTTRWTVLAHARDNAGRPVRPADPSATAWDIEGAIAVSCNKFGILPPFFMVLLDEVAAEYGVMSAGELNDSFCHEIVLEVLRKAIARCQTNG